MRKKEEKLENGKKDIDNFKKKYNKKFNKHMQTISKYTYTGHLLNKIQALRA